MQNGQAFHELHGGATTNGHSPDPRIVRALELIYNPRSPNENRREASQFLEQLKSQDEAPYIGFVFASDKANPAIVRHFGLSLLDNAIRLRWMNFSAEQKVAIRDWILGLARSVDKSDAAYIRNKIAQLWVEVAKRSWALDWMDMDERLVELWPGSTVQKGLVLEVLETLSESAFGKEDAIAALRGSDLNKACVEIFTPFPVIAKHFPQRDATVNVRYGSEGWLTRISDLLEWCLRQDQSSHEVQSCATRALSTLRSVVSWVLPPAVAETGCVQRTYQLMMRGNPSMQLVRSLPFASLGVTDLTRLQWRCSRRCMRGTASKRTIFKPW